MPDLTSLPLELLVAIFGHIADIDWPDARLAKRRGHDSPFDEAKELLKPSRLLALPLICRRLHWPGNVALYGTTALTSLDAGVRLGASIRRRPAFGALITRLIISIRPEGEQASDGPDIAQLELTSALAVVMAAATAMTNFRLWHATPDVIDVITTHARPGLTRLLVASLRPLALTSLYPLISFHKLTLRALYLDGFSTDGQSSSLIPVSLQNLSTFAIANTASSGVGPSPFDVLLMPRLTTLYLSPGFAMNWPSLETDHLLSYVLAHVGTNLRHLRIANAQPMLAESCGPAFECTPLLETLSFNHGAPVAHEAFFAALPSTLRVLRVGEPCSPHARALIRFVERARQLEELHLRLYHDAMSAVLFAELVHACKNVAGVRLTTAPAPTLHHSSHRST